MAISLEPYCRQRPAIPRRLDMVDHALRHRFSDLLDGRARWPLYLHGAVGTGKTLAALSLCDHAQPSYWTTVERLVDRRMAKDESCFETISTMRLIVLDEIGARQKDLDVFYQVIQDVADHREHKNRVAVYVSNLSPPELADLYDDRIASRLLCGTIYELTGPDRRME